MASPLELLLLTQMNTLINTRPQVITNTVLGSSTSTVTFSAIPQTFTNLRLLISAKSDGTGTNGYDSASMQFNGVATASYSWNSWYNVQGGSSMTALSTSSVTSAQCAEIWNNHFTTPGRGIATIDIPNYSDGNNYKAFTSQSSATDGGAAGIMQTYSGCLDAFTSAVTSITVTMGVGNFIADSTFTLYGM